MGSQRSLQQETRDIQEHWFGPTACDYAEYDYDYHADYDYDYDYDYETRHR
jgi:hypothetical protein